MTNSKIKFREYIKGDVFVEIRSQEKEAFYSIQNSFIW